MQEQPKQFVFTNIKNKAGAFGGIFKTNQGVMRPTSVLHLDENQRQSRFDVIEARPLDYDCIGLQFKDSFIEIILSDYDSVRVLAIDGDEEGMIGLAFGGVLINISLKDITANDVLNHLNDHLTLVH